MLKITGNLDNFINDNFITRRKDLHDIEMKSLDTLMQHLINNDNVNYNEKWDAISKLKDCQKKRNLITIIKDSFEKNKYMSLEKINEDWFLDFWDKAQNISDNEFQKIWSVVLETEAETPGTISKKLLHQLYMMNSEEAKSFIYFSRFCFGDGSDRNLYHPIIFMKNDHKAYNALGMNTEILENLQLLDLIQCDYNDGYSFKRKKAFFYHNKYILVIKDGNIPAGNVKLTKTGQDLMNLICKNNNDKILNHTIEQWIKNGCSIQVNNRLL